MVNTVSKKKKKNSSLITSVAAGILALGTATAQTVEQEQGLTYEVSLAAGISRTDNILLLPEPGALYETVYQVTPAFSLDYSSDRVGLNARYRFDHYDYRTLDTDSQAHQYDVTMTNELIEDAFFFDLGGSRTQSIVDPDAIIPPGNLQISNNLVDRDDYYLSPRIEKRLTNSVTTKIEYRYEDISYGETDEELLLDTVNETALFQIDNHARQSGLSFLLAYRWEHGEYDNEAVLPWEYQQATGSLGYWLGDSLRVFGSGGQESAWDDPIDRSLQDEFWEAGFEALGGGRYRAEFAAGQRSFGDSWRGDVEITLRRGKLTFRYAQEPTTTGADQFSPGLLNPNDPNDILATPSSAERYISNRGEIVLSLEGRRSTLDFILFDEERTGRFQADGTELPDEGQRGGTISFSFRTGPRSDFVGYASVYKRNVEQSDDVDYRFANLTYNYRLGTRLTLSLAYEYGEQKPSENSTVLEYESNLVSLFVSYAIGG